MFLDDFGKKKRKQTGVFSARVITLALSIPKGKVTTYGRISRAAGGGTLGAQSVTNILAKAWDKGEKRIPFHRIVYANGKIWIDEKHRAERMRLYKHEKIAIDENGKVKNFEKIVFDLK